MLNDKLNSDEENIIEESLNADNALEILLKSHDSNILKGFSKDDLFKVYNSAFERRLALRNLNKSLNHKLLNSFNRTKSGLVAGNQSSQNHSSITNETLQQYNDLLREYSKICLENDRILAEYSEQSKRIVASFGEAKKDHTNLVTKKEELTQGILKDMFGSKTSRNIKSEIDDLILYESQSNSDTSSAQLENLKLAERFTTLKEAIQTSNEAMTGCHLIDYEQLTAENQTLQEKIDDRMKEVQKLEEKTNQEITGFLHIEEKLCGIQSEHEILDDKISELEQCLSELKKDLNEKRIKKDSLIKEVAKEQNLCVSLLFSPKKVLKNFENVGKENMEMKKELSDSNHFQ